MSESFPEPKSLGGRVKVELDWSNYATKADLKNATGVTGADPERIYEFSKFQYEKMSAALVGRQRTFFILDELKQS